MSQPSPAAPARSTGLDLFKTLLVCGMVGAHVIQLLGGGLGDSAHYFAEFINLISFSGFMLAFGLGTGLRSGSSNRRSLPARLRPALLMLLAVYVSSLAFAVLMDRRAINPALLADLLTLRVLFGYSEFLATFFVLYLLIGVARPLLLGIAGSLPALVVAIALCLLSTLVVARSNLPLLGTLVGHANYANFPLLPYLPWFLVGLRLGMGREPRGAWLLVPTAIATGTFVAARLMTGEFPQRFPPSVPWILGPALPLLLYGAVAAAVSNRIRLPRLLLAPGRHVLAALLISNIGIFAARRRFGAFVESEWQVVPVTLAILMAVLAWSVGIEMLRRRRVRATAPS